MDPDFYMEMTEDDDHILIGELLESSDEEDRRAVRGESEKRRRPNFNRHRDRAAELLAQQYFIANPIYKEKFNWRQSRLTFGTYDRRAQTVSASKSYFTQKQNCTGRQGLSTDHKITAAIVILSFGVCGDALDENNAIGESTAFNYVHEYCEKIVRCFGGEYLRDPTMADFAALLSRYKKEGFSGMMGKIDCSK